MSSIGAKSLTFKKWLALPETKQRYEIVDGVMLMAPAPTPTTQWVMQRILMRLTNFVEERELGVVLAAPVDLMIRRSPLRTRQPDVLYLNAERTGITGPAELRGLQFLETTPDLVVEVLSPSNSRRDIDERLADYKRIGVLECWLVSPEAETTEVLHLSPGNTSTKAIFGIDDTLRSEVLSEFALPTRDIF
ncbi:MAG: Uma2 family endonuclease, partial [Chloroflexi bacterium]|nr:Uma2 family endonuclease [Chloroflexota bacterium]